ncbi:MAG: divergent PAP2 family protein [Clostridia bacterium]|nr:divergent PAP2 family protein [Clostridia bacterium]
MNWFLDLVTNPFLITGVSSWAIAQILKVIIHSAVNRKLDLGRLFGDGGMPSGHSATVCSVAVLAALVYGTGSFSFALAAILALVVCHDATGVRRETGKQAVLLNEMIKIVFVDTDRTPEEKLKELVGHTPLQVTVGALLGALNAAVMYVVLF